MRDDTVHVDDIRESIRLIEFYMSGISEIGFIEELDDDKIQLVRDAVVRRLEIIGEVARGLSEEWKDLRPEIPWKKIMGMRNVLAHEYFGVDYETVWRVIFDRLPELMHVIDR